MRTHARVHALAIAVAKKSHFSTLTSSVQVCSVVLFHLVERILQSGPLGVEGEHPVAHCDLFANKTDCIPMELDAGLQLQSLDLQDSVTCCLVLWDCFQFMQPKDLDRMLVACD